MSQQNCVSPGCVGARSAEIAETQTMLQEVTLPSHVWRRHGLPGRPDGGRASLGDMLHKPEVTLDQVPVPSQLLLLMELVDAPNRLLLVQLCFVAVTWPVCSCHLLCQSLPGVGQSLLLAS